jgi:ribokinase
VHGQSAAVVNDGPVVRVAVVGGINVDVFALVDHQPDDAHPAVIAALSDAVGGKGANQAIVAARLGASVRLLGAVGDDDDGVRSARELVDLGIDCRAVRVSQTSPTGRVLGTVTADGSKRTAAMGGANLRLHPEHVTAFEGAIVGSDVVICQLEPPADVVHEMLAIAAAADVPALLDIGPAQGPVREHLALARWVSGNYAEVEVATGIRVHDEATAREAATVMRAHGPDIAAVTVAGAGQLLAWPGGEAWTTPRRDIPIVDTTGAGDAYAATMAVLLAEGMHPRDVAVRASMASTLACRQLGAHASVATRDEIEAML